MWERLCHGMKLLQPACYPPHVHLNHNPTGALLQLKHSCY